MQFGGYPERGVVGAWKTIIDKVIGKRNIYEFDLTKFFDRILWVNLRKNVLSKLPPKQGKWILGLLKSYKEKEKKIYKEEEAKMNDPIKAESLRRLEEDKQLKASLKLMWKKLNESKGIKALNSLYDEQGVPQGYGGSPLLAVETLREEYSRYSENMLMYMDDGLLFWDEEEFSIAEVNKRMWLSSGSNFKKEKSMMVKRDNEWLRPLKFLGIEYNPWSDSIKSSTRKGKSIEMPRLEWLSISQRYEGPYQAKLLRDIEKLPNYSVIKKWGLMDFMVAYMYNEGKTLSGKREYKMELRDKSVSYYLENEVNLNIYNASSYGALQLNEFVKHVSEGKYPGGKLGLVEAFTPRKLPGRIMR